MSLPLAQTQDYISSDRINIMCYIVLSEKNYGDIGTIWSKFIKSSLKSCIFLDISRNSSH